jgi:hypothetical protein
MIERVRRWGSLLAVGAALQGCGGGDTESRAPQDAGAEAEASLPPITAVTLTQAETFTIAEGGGDHLAFPDITRLSDGRILLVYRRGASHVDATGRIMKQFGSADGKTWSTPEVLLDTASIDDRDPSVATLANGDVLVNHFEYRTQSTPSGSLTLHQTYVSRSTDQGATFGAPQELGTDPLAVTAPALVSGEWQDGQGHALMVTASSSAVVESGAQLWVPVYGGHALDMSHLSTMPKGRVSLYGSTDGGQSWAASAVMPEDAADLWLMEPALLSLGQDRLLMQIRTAKGSSPSAPGNLLQTRSEDGGKTWSAYQDLGFPGHAPELLRLANGVLVSAFRELDAAFTHEWVSYMTSVDDGLTWSDRVHVRDCKATECGYPGTLELDGNRVLLVYYAPGGTSIEGVLYDVAVTR